MVILWLFFPAFALAQENLVLKSVLNNRISILLPESFGNMGMDMIVVKYPMADRRPSEVYTNGTGSINVAFSMTQTQVTEEQLPEVEPVLRNQFSNSPGVHFISSKIERINGRNFVKVEFFSTAVDSKVYNRLFVTSLDGRMFIGTFNCTERYYKSWEVLAQKIVGSVKVN